MIEGEVRRGELSLALSAIWSELFVFNIMVRVSVEGYYSIRGDWLGLVNHSSTLRRVYHFEYQYPSE